MPSKFLPCSRCDGDGTISHGDPCGWGYTARCEACDGKGIACVPMTSLEVLAEWAGVHHRFTREFEFDEEYGPHYGWNIVRLKWGHEYGGVGVLIPESVKYIEYETKESGMQRPGPYRLTTVSEKDGWDALAVEAVRLWNEEFKEKVEREERGKEEAKRAELLRHMASYRTNKHGG